jgi:hypothetical protein
MKRVVALDLANLQMTAPHDSGIRQYGWKQDDGWFVL